MHTSRFPRAARCKRRASRAHLYVSAKGTGLVRGCSGWEREGASAGRETTGDDCRVGRVTVTTGAWHDGRTARASLWSRGLSLRKSFLVLHPCFLFFSSLFLSHSLSLFVTTPPDACNAIVSWRDTSRDL